MILFLSITDTTLFLTKNYIKKTIGSFSRAFLPMVTPIQFKITAIPIAPNRSH